MEGTEVQSKCYCSVKDFVNSGILIKVEKNKILNVCKGKVVPELNWLSAVT
jgi:hypothetical protein